MTGASYRGRSVSTHWGKKPHAHAALSPVFRRAGMPPAKSPASCDAGSFPLGTGGAEAGGRGAAGGRPVAAAPPAPPAAPATLPATWGADLSLTWVFLRPLPSVECERCAVRGGRVLALDLL